MVISILPSYVHIRWIADNWATYCACVHNKQWSPITYSLCMHTLNIAVGFSPILEFPQFPCLRLERQKMMLEAKKTLHLDAEMYQLADNKCVMNIGTGGKYGVWGRDILCKIAFEHANLLNKQHILWWCPLVSKILHSIHQGLPPDGGAPWWMKCSSLFTLQTTVCTIAIQHRAVPQRATRRCNVPSVTTTRCRNVPCGTLHDGHAWLYSPTWT